MGKRRSIRKISAEFMSRKIFKQILDDFSIFGSIPFYILSAWVAYSIDNHELFSRLVYTFLLSLIVILVIKNVHYKDRPQKEEFTIFMEKVIASSFPSSHSLFITTLSILLSLAYPQAWLISTVSCLAILVYIQRYVTKKHFFIDIAAGILIGIVEVLVVIKFM